MCMRSKRTAGREVALDHFARRSILEVSFDTGRSV